MSIRDSERTAFFEAMRVRRTNKEVEDAIFNAVTSLSKEMDLTKITLRMVATESHMDMKVLKRRYSDITELLNAYSNRFDSFLTELLNSGRDIPDKADRYGYILAQYLDWVSNNDQVRQLLLWELDDSSDLGFQNGQQRDKHLVRLMSEDFAPQPPGSEKEGVREQIILYLAGLSYLHLNRSDATFIGIRHFSEEGKENLKNGLVRLLKIYFSL